MIAHRICLVIVGLALGFASRSSAHENLVSLQKRVEKLSAQVEGIEALRAAKRLQRETGIHYRNPVSGRAPPLLLQ